MKIVHSFRFVTTFSSSLVLLGLLYGSLWAHTLPIRSEPGVGATLNDPPVCVRIWFDNALDPASSTLIVQNAKGQKVDKGDSHVDLTNPKLLEISLPSLSPGTYRVIWTAVSRDGHKTTGDYIFSIK